MIVMPTAVFKYISPHTVNNKKWNFPNPKWTFLLISGNNQIFICKYIPVLSKANSKSSPCSSIKSSPGAKNFTKHKNLTQTKNYQTSHS